MRTQGKPLIYVIAALLVTLACAASATAAPFGIESFSGSLSDAEGNALTQAGAHPDLTTTVNWVTGGDIANGVGPESNPKDVEVDLPPGLIGDPNAVPTCTRPQLSRGVGPLGCPTDAQVGVIHVTFAEPNGPTASVANTQTFAVYNMQRPANLPAEFGFKAIYIPVYIEPRVRTGGDYGLTASLTNISQSLAVRASTLTLWGVPADPRHDAERINVDTGAGGASSTVPPRPLMTSPTNCSSTPIESMRTDSWQEPGVLVNESFDHYSTGEGLASTGCEKLSFQPTITAKPDTTKADTPAGLTVDVKMSTGGLVNPVGLAAADIQNTTVTLPPGIVINPGQATGLVTCPPSQDAVGTEAAPTCPSASIVGTVSVSTPLLPDKLEGDIYILPSNPPDLKLLVAASADSVNLKLLGDVHLDPVTGQLTTTFANTPELPFTDLKLSFSGGAQAALATPPACGQYTTNADFTPSSAPFEPDVLTADSFTISSGPQGQACSSSLPFAPALIAGATTDQAGGFTSFSLLLTRDDGQQRVSSLQFKTPKGLLGVIGKVPLCQDPQASQGTCSPASQIGHTVVQAGPGPYPLVIPEPGQPPAPIYLTGGYKGAPYGLSIVVPAIAGPFNLGTIVVRASIAVDPHTAQLTITTDPLPSILGGVPTDLRAINAVIDRPGFMFNPTNCNPQSFSGTALSTEGTTAAISSPFQVGSCRSLPFAPKLTATASGRTSRAGGAALSVKLVEGVSGEANVQSLKVDLPKQLPSRLTTLQKACTAAVFEANPASCPAASVVGHATATTPVLPVALSGPAYFVSHGGEAFPSLVIVLQGYGVTVDLVGTTFISKQGITSSTFKTVPDVPVISFDLTLPTGKYSALAANGDLCKSKLAMPTSIVGQNGAVLKPSTKIAVTGCAKAKKKAKPTTHGGGAKAKKKSR